MPVRPASKSTLQLSGETVTNKKILAILVDFSDNTASVASTFFDSLMFDTLGNTVRNYYRENSYDQIDIITSNNPSILGWQRAPQTYAYYVNGQNGTGSYPNNTQKLVEDLIAMIDASVDFSEYDNDNDGWVDALAIIHSGPGAEKTGSSNDIWSHAWGISPQLRDGVYISSFSVQPEYLSNPGDQTIGVYCHEFGHALFGLPDLYDTDYTSKGIGFWGIMSYGSWLGPSNNGGCPSHFCAWSKYKAGFLTPTNVTTNQINVDIPNVEENQKVYRLWNSGTIGNEYFLVENRQKTGFDSYLPSSGLLIWHIDDGKLGDDNDKEWWTGQSASNHYLMRPGTG